jgi:hypothetical protein
MERKRNLLVLIPLLLIALTFFGGCATIGQGGSKLLPSDAVQTISPFKSYEAAEAAFNNVVENKTTIADLKSQGFIGPNTTVQNYVQVVKYFEVATGSANALDLFPDSIKRCLDSKEKCRGYILTLDITQNKDEGNFFKHFLGFRKETHTTGWSASPLFVVINDVVVYKLWSGKPAKDIITDKKNPLGPLNGLGNSIIQKAFDKVIPD